MKIWIYFSAVTLLQCYTSAFEVHKHMTIDEIRGTFHVDSHHLVPEYEIVSIHHVRKRSIASAPDKGGNSLKHGSPEKGPFSKTAKKWNTKNPTPEPAKNIDALKNLKLEAFGQPFNLTLLPNDGLFKKSKLKVFTIEPNATAQHGVEYIEHQETNDDIGDLYQDEENQAAILLRKEGGSLVLEGSIGSQLVIRPVPARLRETVKNKHKISTTDDEVFLDEDGNLSGEISIDTGLPIRRLDGSIDAHDEEVASVHHHIVIKRKEEHGDNMSDYALMEPDHLSKRYKRSATAEGIRKKRDAPYTIYPEILVIVDYDGYRLHGGDNLQIKRYFISFWNGVDLRYKLLKGPKIRVSIAGIIISRGRDATPYLERNRVGRDAIDSAAALTDMGKYLFRERRLPVYDIAVAITKYDMCRRRKGGRCTKGTAGFAYVGGACVVNKRLEKVNSVAIIEDTGGFSGIIVAAHEVGHLLGAVHDGSPPPSYLGGPGAEKCQWADGFIMSDLRHTERGFRWSSCSVASFHHFLNGDTATCLYNTPHEDDGLPRVLPGKLLTLDAQCRRDRGTSACFKDERVCAQLFCFDSGSGYCVAYRPAAEGSTCGDGQYCMNGRCVAEHENIIPDYSQNAPSYVRPNGNPGRPLFSEEELDVSVPDILPPETILQLKSNYPNPPSNSPQFNINYQNKYTTSTQAPTHSSPSWGWFIASSTEKSNSFNNNLPPPTTTQNAYVGSYYAFLQKTTRSPYDFRDFGKKSTENPYSSSGFGYNDNINNNYLKRSYNVASYYVESSSNLNKTLAVSSRT
ncbi:A disintegrin and metalloproteinase with thrombospondin motifs 1 isoform X2 [Anthonomus grandis grandis]|uniref:A disintegrin and metalloproteinase with thrombospondin motifs 1 isoform X2 n=1 Tax=Anthonomus grandis grandis TaxID=2921223 RepID=UPI002166813D|nr:A disintegrin and metalloproteinase with thrombospondin motifs 1 isoform X2 [Anthonomus grandis grandis]